MRHPEERFEEPKFVHDFERGGMDGISAEIAQEIGVFFEDNDRDAGASQKITQDHAGRATPGDTAARFEPFLGSGQGSPKLRRASLT